MIIAIVLLISSALSFFGTYACIRLAKMLRIMDKPGPRSSHKVLTPRIGGIALFFAFAVSSVIGFVFAGGVAGNLAGVSSGMTQMQLAGIAIGMFCFFIFGLLDDVFKFRAPAKALVPLAIIIFTLAMGLVVKTITLPYFGKIGLGILSLPLTLLWVFFFTNVFNFMDGIDGLAAGFSSIVSVFLIIISAISGNYLIMIVSAAALGSSLGFLKHNFPPATIFMGDSSSLFLGFLFSELLVIGETTSTIPFTVMLLLLGVFIFDGAFTIIRRLFFGKNIFLAHKEHLYQRLLKIGYTHRKVSLMNYALAFILGLLALLILLSVPLISLLALLSGAMILVVWAFYVTALEKEMLNPKRNMEIKKKPKTN